MRTTDAGKGAHASSGNAGDATKAAGKPEAAMSADERTKAIEHDAAKDDRYIYLAEVPDPELMQERPAEPAS